MCHLIELFKMKELGAPEEDNAEHERLEKQLGNVGNLEAAGERRLQRTR